MPDKSSGSTGKNGKKKKGRWGFKAMGSSLNAMAMAGQRLKSKLQRGRKMDAMSSEFTALNEVRAALRGLLLGTHLHCICVLTSCVLCCACSRLRQSCKESRKLVGSIATKTEALRRAGDGACWFWLPRRVCTPRPAHAHTCMTHIVCRAPVFHSLLRCVARLHGAAGGLGTAQG